ncbi:hypothetical protein [Luteolibacter sp. AS25]|uniref:hypothetical protein n=1 Tax=Luteolibacter sp. AS25 TaxID=3135776 RepID=UPI00398B5243
MKTTAILLISILVFSVAARASVEKIIVPVQIGAKAFRDGDVVQISEVISTSRNLEPGDVVTVRGRYRLDSIEAARLILLVTQTESDGFEETDKSQIVQAKRGWHEFEATLTIKHRGFLHLTFYDGIGEPIGGVYFGTPFQMAKAKDLSVAHYKVDR